MKRKKSLFYASYPIRKGGWYLWNGVNLEGGFEGDYADREKKIGVELK
jgi:hypothetical protein